jgi:hypothetical protein
MTFNLMVLLCAVDHIVRQVRLHDPTATVGCANGQFLNEPAKLLVGRHIAILFKSQLWIIAHQHVSFRCNLSHGQGTKSQA